MEIFIPRFDPAMQKAKILKWMKKRGERVEKDEVIALLEGEKTVFELLSPISGVLSEVLAGEGEEVEVGRAVAIVSEEAREKVLATPLAKKLAREYGIDLSVIKPRKPGRITKEDVLEHVRRIKGGEVEEAERAEVLEFERVPLSEIRRTIADRLSYSQRRIPQASLSVEVISNKIFELKSQLEKKLGKKVSLTAIMVKAVAEALRENPIMNSRFEEGEIRLCKNVNICVAIQTDKGLVAPAIFDVDKKSILEITNAISELRRRAEEEKLTIEEMTMGTFTLSNLGPYGVSEFTPIINPPQVAILGVGASDNRAVVELGKVVVRKVMKLTLVFDHRAVDGVPAANFLIKLKQILERPEEHLKL